MTDASVLKAIGGLIRSDIAAATFRFISPESHFARKTTVRLRRLSRFWESAVATSLREASEDFVTGLYGHDCEFTFAILGQKTGVSCWIGAEVDSLDQSGMDTLVRSSFPDSRCTEEQFPIESVRGFRYGFVVAGCPDIGDQFRENERYRLEKLVRSLAESNFLYVVSGAPVDPDEISQGAALLTRTIDQVRLAYLLSQNPAAGAEHAATRYVKLLERSLERQDEALASGMWRVRCSFYTDNPALLPRARHALHGAFSGPGSHPCPIRVRPCLSTATEEPLLDALTSRELASLTRPLAEDAPGYETTEYTRFGLEGPPANEMDSINLGEIRDRGRSTNRGFLISKDVLTQHALVVGVTGAGKTNTCFQLLEQIWDGGKGVPFLAIESAKAEYRSLLTSPRFAGLRVFTIGDETVAPLRLNPFEVPPGIAVQTHADYIRSLFSAAFVLYPPMPYVLERAIQGVYEDRGWNMTDNSNPRGGKAQLAFPTLDDLAEKTDEIIEKMGYDQRITMDVRAGLRARIDQLRFGGGKGHLLNTRVSIDSAVLFDSPCLFELKNIVDDDEKAFIIGLILVRLYEHREASWDGASSLKHVTLIEEAHRLLRNTATGQSSDIAANPKGRAIEIFANLLSEIRAYGEGIIVAEQIPTKLANDVIKNTVTKIVHRLVSEDDRALVAGAINLDAIQTRHLVRLDTGEAVVWTNGMEKAAIIGVRRFSGSSRMAVSAEELRTLTPTAFATACPACGRGHRPLNIRASQDPQYMAQFWRFYNSLRFKPEMAPLLLGDFRNMLSRAAMDERSDIDCTMLTLARRALDRRGANAGWPHDYVETRLAHIQLALTAMHDGKLPAALEEEPRISPVFKGCEECASPCVYRQDAVAMQGAKRFRAALADPRCTTQRLSEMALDAAAEFVSPRDVGSLKGAALCFSVQQCAAYEVGLSPDHQLVMSRLIRQQLEEQV